MNLTMEQLIHQKETITMYGNLLVNNSEKLDILKHTFPQWVDYWGSDVVLRIRGSLAHETIQFCNSISPKVRCSIGSNFLQWRKQTHFDISNVKSNYIMLYLEDHMLSINPPNASNLIVELAADEIQVFQYSWNQQYLKIAESLLNHGSKVNKASISKCIDKSLLIEMMNVEPRYLISLTSIFQRNFFLKLLDSPRPYLRKFNPRTPFDVEQRPNNTWFLPLTFGLPRSELGICVDDDNTVSGSSAISRGLYNGIRPTRGELHHSKSSTINLAWELRRIVFGKSVISFIPLRVKLILTSIIFWPTYISYTLQAPILRLLDSINAVFIAKRNLK